MPPKPDRAADPLIARLRSMARESPSLKEAAARYEAILPLLRTADLRTAAVPLTAKQVRQKLEQGVPLLHDVDLELDVEAVQELTLKLARAIEAVDAKRHSPGFHFPWAGTAEAASSVRKLRQVLEGRRLDLAALLPHIAKNDRASVESVARQLEVDAGLVMVLGQNALRPAFQTWGRQLAPLSEGIPWNKGACYVCGAAAMLGELQDNDQVKHLRCGFCGADWVFRRLQCAFCGNEDHKSQRYFFAEGQGERARVEVCDRCKGYLKVIAAFAPTPSEMLPVEDLATVHLDFIAKERGYRKSVVHSSAFVVASAE